MTTPFDTPPPGRGSNTELLDREALRRGHERSAATVEASDTLSRLTREELLDRLDLIAAHPNDILDAGGGTGVGALALAKRYPRARTVLLDHAAQRCRQAERRRGWRRRFTVVRGDVQAMPFADESFDMVFSNLCLQDCLPPDEALREARRVLRDGGLYLFATLGPGTLAPLRDAWCRVGDRAAHVHDFIDMHDLGEALARRGFRDPVLDVDRLRFSFPSYRDLVLALRGAGATCAALTRRRGLTGKTAHGAVLEALGWGGGRGEVVVPVEVVYGHAWVVGPAPAASREDQSVGDIGARGEVAIPASSVRRRR